MSKNLNDLINDDNSEEGDILDDLQDDDFVFVISKTGQLRGISWPLDMDDEDEVDPAIEELITYLLSKFDETIPPGSTLQ